MLKHVLNGRTRRKGENGENAEIAWNTFKIVFYDIKMAKFSRFHDIDLEFCIPIHHKCPFTSIPFLKIKQKVMMFWESYGAS